jgi:hypothetical protein
MLEIKSILFFSNIRFSRKRYIICKGRFSRLSMYQNTMVRYSSGSEDNDIAFKTPLVLVTN